MTLADLERLFTTDSTMVVNGVEIGSSLPARLARTKEMLSFLKSWRFHTPFERIIVEGNVVAAYYMIDIETIGGEKSRAYDMAFWTLRDRKVAATIENVVFENSTGI